MIRQRQAVVSKILYFDDHISEIEVKVDNQIQKAINYNKLTGIVSVGDKVIINTSAVYLQLGTGGYHFVMHNENHKRRDFSTDCGHIMKLRYTPLQVKCLTVEEPQSPYHELIKDKDNINEMKVLIGSLHSMLSPAIHILKYYQPNLKIAYIMTDSACLPIAFSQTVRKLKKHGLLKHTITCGQAFGGDFEAVNIYTALLAAKHICKCDIVIITAGPGVVGTESMFGFSGIEGGGIIDAVNILKGVPIFIPRISFADSRKRHKGISHHTITILTRITHSMATIALPRLNEEQDNMIKTQLALNGIHKRHKIQYVEEDAIYILEKENVITETMGRNIRQDIIFFKTVGAAATFCLAM